MQATIIQDTNYLIPNKDHKNFTDSGIVAKDGSVVFGEYRNVSGLRKGKPFVYRLFFTKNGKILYANCVETKNASSEILSNADNSQSATLVDFIPAEKFKYTAHLLALGGGVAGYFYGKKQNVTGNNLIKYIAVGAVGAYAIYSLIDKNKSTIIKPSK
jgi:hypothetical protein